MPTRNINLTEHFDHFIEAGISAGRYQNASEVVRAALRLLEQHEAEDAAKLERLREAVRIGLEQSARGDVIEIADDDLDDFMEELGEEATRLAREGGANC